MYRTSAKDLNVSVANFFDLMFIHFYAFLYSHIRWPPCFSLIFWFQKLILYASIYGICKDIRYMVQASLSSSWYTWMSSPSLHSTWKASQFLGVHFGHTSTKRGQSSVLWWNSSFYWETMFILMSCTFNINTCNMVIYVEINPICDHTFMLIWECAILLTCHHATHSIWYASFGVNSIQNCHPSEQ